MYEKINELLQYADSPKMRIIYIFVRALLGQSTPAQNEQADKATKGDLQNE